MLVRAQQDDMVPHAHVEEAHARLGATSELVSYDRRRFDLYVETTHADNARRQADRPDQRQMVRKAA